MHAGRQMRRHIPHHRALDRADIGNDRAWFEVGRDLLRHRAAGADGNAEDDEVGACDGLRVGFEHAVDDAELGDPRAGLGRTCRGDDLAGKALRPRGARDRAADQTEADQRSVIEDRAPRSLARHEVTQARRRPAGWLPRVPTVMRNCMMEAVVVELRAAPGLAGSGIGSASLAEVLPFSSGKWISTKLATLGVTLRPSLLISSVSQLSHCA